MQELFFDQDGFLLDDKGLKLGNKNYLILKYISNNGVFSYFEMDVFENDKVFSHYLSTEDGIVLSKGEKVSIYNSYFFKSIKYLNSVKFIDLKVNTNYILYTDDKGIHLFEYILKETEKSA